MLPFVPLFPIDFKSSWDKLLVAVADTLNTSASHAGQFPNYTSLYSRYR